MKIIKKYPDKPWDWTAISRNQNITMEMIKKYPDKEWNCWMVFVNKFIKEKELFELRVNKQRFVQDHSFEQLVMKTCHPDKVKRYLEMGYSLEELDDIM